MYAEIKGVILLYGVLEAVVCGADELYSFILTDISCFIHPIYINVEKHLSVCN